MKKLFKKAFEACVLSLGIFSMCLTMYKAIKEVVKK